jgi:hypothetical protein
MQIRYMGYLIWTRRSSQDRAFQSEPALHSQAPGRKAQGDQDADRQRGIPQPHHEKDIHRDESQSVKSDPYSWHIPRCHLKTIVHSHRTHRPRGIVGDDTTNNHPGQGPISCDYPRGWMQPK